MNHHSQFKCVRAVDPIAPRDPRARPYEHPYNAFHALADAPETAFDDRQSALNQCSLAPAAPGVPPSVTCTPVGRPGRRGRATSASPRSATSTPRPTASTRAAASTSGSRRPWPAPATNPRTWTPGATFAPATARAPSACSAPATPGPSGACPAAARPTRAGRTARSPAPRRCSRATTPRSRAAIRPRGTAPSARWRGRAASALWMCGGVTTTSVASRRPRGPALPGEYDSRRHHLDFAPGRVPRSHSCGVHAGEPRRPQRRVAPALTR
jgi:hypothetical protein